MMQDNKIKIGDLVETCSLMPGIVMTINGDTLGIRMLHHTNEETPFKGNTNTMIFSQCSLGHCGIIKITPQQVINRLVLGKDKLAEIWSRYEGDDGYYEEVDEIKIKVI